MEKNIGIILVTYKVTKPTGTRELTDYFADLTHFHDFAKRNRNKVELISWKKI